MSAKSWRGKSPTDNIELHKKTEVVIKVLFYNFDNFGNFFVL